MQQRKLRRKARQTSIQVLYANEVAGVSIKSILSGNTSLPFLEEIDPYAYDLISGTAEHKKEIDTLIDSISKNWALERMPVVDRCLLRQTVYEMKYFDDVPISVSINEAVELAKKYGAEDDSHKFVNGILGKVALELEK